MTNRKRGQWLLVAFAIVGLAFAAPAVSAHGDEPTPGNETASDEIPADGDAASWATWMEGHMTDHMGPGAVEEMESHMGVTVDELAHDVADDTHTELAHDVADDNHTELAHDVADDNHTAGGMNGQGHGC